MKIGISYWGVCADYDEHRFSIIDTPDGHRFGRPLLIRALENAGHEIFALQPRREQSAFSNIKYVYDGKDELFPDLDVVFLEWRWSTYKNDKNDPKHDPSLYEGDLDRQREIIEFYRGKIPIIAWDTDLKITPDDEERWPELIIADPSLSTNRLTRDRVSLPFWSDWKLRAAVKEPYPVYGYVGNNYERPSEFLKFYFDVSSTLRADGIQTSMFGNWLQTSPERSPPKSMIRMNPNVSFNHRMNFYDSMNIMNRFICTTHISKHRYYMTGFISPRYMEALSVGCPGLVPSAQIYNGVLGREWVVCRTYDTVEKVKFISKLSLEDRLDLVQAQTAAMQKVGKFDVNNVVSFIESVK